MSDQDLILERLASIEAKLDRVAAVENAWTNLPAPGQHRRSGPGFKPSDQSSVKLLTEELAEVETGFQMEDILAMVNG